MAQTPILNSQRYKFTGLKSQKLFDSIKQLKKEHSTMMFPLPKSGQQSDNLIKAQPKVNTLH